MFRNTVLFPLACLSLLAACQMMGLSSDQKEGANTTLPPVVKVTPMRPAEASGLGVILDGWAGNELATKMDDSDRARNQQAEKRAFTAPIGQQITWNDSDNGNAGTITATKDAYDRTGVYCREFRQSVTVSGKQQQGYGKACQQQDGSWKIVQ